MASKPPTGRGQDQATPKRATTSMESPDGERGYGGHQPPDSGIGMAIAYGDAGTAGRSDLKHAVPPWEAGN